MATAKVHNSSLSIKSSVLDDSDTNGRNIEDPDTLFANFPIAEVKRFQMKLQFDVDAKQQELRNMVGERYRELLQASSAILAMSNSARLILACLNNLRGACEKEPNPEFSGQLLVDVKKDQQLQEMQILAAHIKLLLDAPEHLWRLLERKQFLQASLLFFLSRLVYHVLKKHGVDEENEQLIHDIHVLREFPIIHRQWELLFQFRAQIIHRCKQALRDEDEDPLKPACHLLSLHLLENISPSEALTLFLEHRLKSLMTVLSGVSQQNSVQVEQIQLPVLLRARDLVSNTVVSARRVFITQVDGSDEGLFMKAISESQSENTSSNDLLIPSAETLLKKLQSTSYLELLPQSIKAYKPVFDLTSATYMVAKKEQIANISAWIDKAMQQLKNPLSQLFSNTDSIRAVWNLRNRLDLTDESNPVELGEFLSPWGSVLIELCKQQSMELWQRRLQRLSAQFCTAFRVQLTLLANETSDTVSQSQFLLCPISLRVNTKSITSNTLNPLSASLQRSLTMHIPAVDEVLGALETESKRLYDDVGWIDKSYFQNALAEDYEYDVMQCISGLLEMLRSLPSEIMNSLPDSSITQRLILLNRATCLSILSGQVSRVLTVTTNFFANIRISQTNTEKIKSLLSSIYMSSLRSWQEDVVAHGSQLLMKAFTRPKEVEKGPHISTPTQPSAIVFQCCSSIIQSARQMNMDLLNDFGMIKVMQDSYLSILTVCMQSLKLEDEICSEALLQQILNLNFLKLLTKCCFKSSSPSREIAADALSRTLRTLLIQVESQCPDKYAEMRPKLTALDRVVQSSLLLFSPLFDEQVEREDKERGSSLSAVTVDNSLNSILNLVKPSNRIIMVQISS